MDVLKIFKLYYYYIYLFFEALWKLLPSGFSVFLGTTDCYKILYTFTSNKAKIYILKSMMINRVMMRKFLIFDNFTC